MAYSLPTAVAPRKRSPDVSRARPKTHTPGPRLQQRGFRYYSSNLGRWLSRDPIEEKGGANLHIFLGNDGVNNWDILGREWIEDPNDRLMKSRRIRYWSTNPSDTIEDLKRKGYARLSSLEWVEWRKWLEVADNNGPLPTTRAQALGTCRTVSAPNTVYLIAGTTKPSDGGAWTRMVNQGYINMWVGYYTIKATILDYHVEPLYKADWGVVNNAIGNNDIYGLIYVGHGGDGFTVYDPGPTEFRDYSTVDALARLPHGLAFVNQLGCSTFDNGSGLPGTSAVDRLVSATGRFLGVSGDWPFYYLGIPYIQRDRPGTYTPP